MHINWRIKRTRVLDVLDVLGIVTVIIFVVVIIVVSSIFVLVLVCFFPFILGCFGFLPLRRWLDLADRDIDPRIEVAVVDQD